MDEETRDHTAGAQSGGSGITPEVRRAGDQGPALGAPDTSSVRGVNAAGTAAPAAPAVAAVAPPAPGLEPNVSAATLAVVQELVSQGSALLTSAARGGAGQSAGRVRPPRGAAGKHPHETLPRRAGGLGTWIT